MNKVVQKNAPVIDNNELKLETFGVGFKMDKSKGTSATEESTEFFNIPLHAGTMSKNDWKARLDALEKLSGIAERNVDTLQESPKFVTLLEAIIRGLTDSNGKVALRAVAALEQLFPISLMEVTQGSTPPLLS